MKILVVDDHPLVRLGVLSVLAREWPTARIDEAETLADAIRLFGEAEHDLVLLDLALPDAQGLEGLSRMLRVVRGKPILVVSLSKESAFAHRVLQLGAFGYVSKDKTGDELVTAVHRILAGGRYVNADIAERLLALLEGKSPNALPHEALTTQEYRVMQLIAAGVRPAQIAETMHLSVKTIGNYRSRIFEKTGWRTNNELTKYCVQHGLTDPG